MEAQLNPVSGDYSGQRIDTLANAVYLRLMTPLGSWWGDTTLGSRLHELQREKDVVRVFKLAKQYAEQALQPLIIDLRARRVDVQPVRRMPGWCDLHIEVEDATGQRHTFQHPVAVG